MVEKKRDIFFDIAKGLAIISVVVGHCWPLSKRFVFSYHLLLFFFISGFFYNRKKYEKDPIGNIINKLKNNYPKYFIYSAFFLLIHNFLFNLGVISAPEYTIADFIKNGINLTMMVPSETLAGAMWFVPVMIYAISIFGVLVYIGSKFKNKLKSLIFVGFFSCILGLLGLIINEKAMWLFLHIETSLVIMPVIFLAYICRILYDNKIDFRKYLTWYGFLISLGLIFLILRHYPTYLIELAVHNIFTKKMFFIVVIVGLYMSLSFTKLISNVKFLSTHIAWIGKYSFEIMAFHFLIFKLIDFLYFKFNSEIILYLFPISDPKLWFIYSVVGIYGSLLLYFALLKLKDACIWFLNFIKSRKMLSAKLTKHKTRIFPLAIPVIALEYYDSIVHNYDEE